MNLPRFLSACIFVAALNPAYSVEVNRPDILKIFDQFVTSSAAASRCIKPNNETLNHFLANFQMVSVYAYQELAKQYPKHTKEQIAEAMKKKSELITQKVFALVREKGCEDPSIQDAVKRFAIQANWQPGK